MSNAYALMARLVADDTKTPFVKIDPLKLDIEFIESKISRPFARRHQMVPLHIRDGRLVVAVVNPGDVEAVELYREMVRQEIEVVVTAESDARTISIRRGRLLRFAAALPRAPWRLCA